MRGFGKFIFRGHIAPIRSLLITGVICTISACAYPPKNISESFDLGNNGGYLTDAKTRVIIAQDPSFASRPGAIYPTRITCVEPHPDVASTVANSLSVGLSIFAKGSSSISRSQAEGLAQIAQRTVSIQTLQRLMFRACEAYANGGITGTGYSLLLSEINRTMVTLILAETAGARFGQSGAAIGGESSAIAYGRVSDLEGMLNELQASQESVDETAAKLKDSSEKAETILSSAQEDETVTTSETEAIEEARQQVKEDTEGFVGATERLQRASNAVALTGVRISKVEGIGQRDVVPSGEIASVLAEMQGNFLSKGNIQHYISACLVELGLGSDSNASFPDTIAINSVSDLPSLLMKLTMLKGEKSEIEEEKENLELAIKNKETDRQNDLNSIKKELDTKTSEIKHLQKQLNEIAQYISTYNLVEVQTAAKKALAERASNGRNGGLRNADLIAFVYRIYHLNRKSGLFTNCQENLAVYLTKVDSLERERMQHDTDLKMKMLDAAVAVVDAGQNSDTAKFAFCHLLPDVQLKRECVANLSKRNEPHKIPVDKPDENKPPPVPEKNSLPNIVSDVRQEVITLQALLPKLTVQLSKLKAFKGDKIQVPSHPNPETLPAAIRVRFDELVSTQAGLKKSLSDTATRGDMVHPEISNQVSQMSAELDKLQKSYNSTVSNQTRVDTESRKLGDAKLESFVNLAEAFAQLTKIWVTELEKTIKEVTNLVELIAQHNANVTAFKPS